MLTRKEVQSRVPKCLVNFAIDPELLTEIDAAADDDGMSRSEWIRDSLRAKLVWRRDPEAFTPSKPSESEAD